MSTRETREHEDQSAIWGTALIVLLVLLALVLVGYFVWYAPVMQSEQSETNIRVTVPGPSPPQAPSPPSQPGGTGAGSQPAQPAPQPQAQPESTPPAGEPSAPGGNETAPSNPSSP